MDAAMNEGGADESQKMDDDEDNESVLLDGR
jgi:hypothetical protein